MKFAKYALSAQHETEVRAIEFVASLGCAKSIVAELEAAGNWPEGFDAVATHLATGDRWLLEDYGTTGPDQWEQIQS